MKIENLIGFQSEESAAEGTSEEVPIEKRPGFLHAIKLPLVSVLPRKLRSTKVSLMVE